MERLNAVPYVDLKHYLGKWYEIATIPQRFQKGCVAVTAEYSLLPNGDIEVVNTCRQDTLDGKVRAVRGRARVVDRKYLWVLSRTPPHGRGPVPGATPRRR